ncbi:hypothetical protein [Burkholderia cepacia]|uniref:hypothetical protein n=1 Tax=Burkholderia cepacia TaxID=292 RepID=UPI000A5B0C24|nr:hypothetical protein [Burkholderia cepacia]
MYRDLHRAAGMAAIGGAASIVPVLRVQYAGRQDFPDMQAAAPSRFTAHRGCRQVVGNRMDIIATFNWSLAIDFAIVNDARVRSRTVPSAAHLAACREFRGAAAGPTSMGRRVR